MHEGNGSGWGTKTQAVAVVIPELILHREKRGEKECNGTQTDRQTDRQRKQTTTATVQRR
jgi:hypothetical protein